MARGDRARGDHRSNPGLLRQDAVCGPSAHGISAHAAAADVDYIHPRFGADRPQYVPGQFQFIFPLAAALENRVRHF
jgi:hypothetical protein